MLSILKKNIINIKKNFNQKVFSLFKRSELNEETYKKLEERLIQADIGVITAQNIINNLKKEATLLKCKNNLELHSLLKNNMLKILKKVEKPLKINKKPFIILIIGVNGVGKTTTIEKLAYFFKKKGKSILLAAGDTFRAAGVEQLKILGKKHNIPVISNKINSDSASVIFEAMKNAKEKNIDILIADTAGRLQNKKFLMNELKKIVKIIHKIDSSAPHEKILILDSNTGQNSINQTKIFHQEIKITGIIITKLDGTAKGGIIFSISNEFNIPIRYITLGNSVTNLQDFNAKIFIDALFEKNASSNINIT